MNQPYKVFVSGRWTRKQDLRAVKKLLDMVPYVEVTSSWLDSPDDLPDCVNDEYQAKYEGLRDINECGGCEIMFIDTNGTGGGGRYVELGYHISKWWQTGLRIRVGPARTIYDHLVDKKFEKWEEALEWFTKWLGKQSRYREFISRLEKTT